jgi:hypothetical protein
MYNHVKIYRHFPVVLAVITLFNCIAIPEKAGKEIIVEEIAVVKNQSAGAGFSEIVNTIWELCEIRIGYGRIELNRQAMAHNGLGDTFILQFTEEGINGKAAPNRYFSTYELMYDHDFRLRPIVGTLMAADINIGGLMENEYYWYLQRAGRWGIINNRLELYGVNPNEEFTLVFLPQTLY